MRRQTAQTRNHSSSCFDDRSQTVVVRMHHDEAPTVQLPLESLDKCSICSRKRNLRLCAACGERIYCSTTCQRRDWSGHKTVCGETIRLDLKTFYPVLAMIFDRAHTDDIKPKHPAFRHQILEAPTSRTTPLTFPGGVIAKRVVLGEALDEDGPGHHGDGWWPSAPSADIKTKLMRRITREHWVLPILLSCCFSLLDAMYTTGSTPNRGFARPRRRIRLQYRKSPIADFGIVKGSVTIQPHHKLIYVHPESRTVLTGQDPNDHYWFYFTTISGETFTLDCGLFAFGFGAMVHIEEYSKGVVYLEPVLAPAYLGDRHIANLDRDFHKTGKKFSVLRNEDLHTAIQYDSDPDTRVRSVYLLKKFMEEVSGRGVSWKETELASRLTAFNTSLLYAVFDAEAWKKWPDEPRSGYDTTDDAVSESFSTERNYVMQFMNKKQTATEEAGFMPDT